jgi:hypothetical protein
MATRDQLSYLDQLSLEVAKTLDIGLGTIIPATMNFSTQYLVSAYLVNTVMSCLVVIFRCINKTLNLLGIPQYECRIAVVF